MWLHYSSFVCRKQSAEGSAFPGRKRRNEKDFSVYPPVSYTHLDVYKRQGRTCAGMTAGRLETDIENVRKCIYHLNIVE